MHRDSPIRVRLRASLKLAVLLTVAHVAAIASFWPLAVAPSIKLAFGAIALASCGFFLLRDALLRLSGSVIAIELAEEGACVLTDRAGRERKGAVLGDSFVSSFLTVVRCRLIGQRRRRSVVIFPDAVDGEEFRRLRVWLRWKTSPRA